MSRKLIVNSASNVLDFVVTVAITFLLTPIYIKSFGMYDYGLWEIVNAIVGYMGLLDLGMGQAIVRQTSFFNQQKNSAKINVLYATSLIYMSLVGLVLLAVATCWAFYSPEYLAEDASQSDKYQTFLLIVGFSIFFGFILSTCQGMLGGKQLYVARNNSNLVIKIIVAVILAVYLTEENGINFMLQVTLLATIARIIIYNIILIRQTPSVTFFAKPSFNMFKQLITFGGKSLVNGIAFMIENRIGIILIGTMLSPALVPILSIPMALTGYVVRFLESITQAFLPYLTEIEAKKESDALWNNYIFLTKICLSYLLISTAFMFFYGAEFIDLWLNKTMDFEETTRIVFWLCISLIIDRFNPLGTKVAIAMNKHGMYAKFRPISAVLITILTYMLIPLMGVVGVVVALISVRAVFATIYIYYISSYFNKSFFGYFKEAIIPNAFLGGFVFAVCSTLKNSVVVTSFVDILWAGILTVCLGVVGVSIFVLNSTEKKRILAMTLKK